MSWVGSVAFFPHTRPCCLLFAVYCFRFNIDVATGLRKWADVCRLSGSLKCSWCFAKVSSTKRWEREDDSSRIRLGFVSVRSRAETWTVGQQNVAKVNVGEDWVKDNGIKLKSKLSFILYFWLKHEFCQLLPSGASFWFAWDWISQHTSNNGTASKIFAIRIRAKVPDRDGDPSARVTESKRVSQSLTQAEQRKKKMRAARYLIYTWWRSSFVWYNH